MNKKKEGKKCNFLIISYVFAMKNKNLMPKEATHTDIHFFILNLLAMENWQNEVVISIRNNVQNICFLEF